MKIREYENADEQGWLRCRVVAFLDCSYFNDVKTKKEHYVHPSICLVAEESETIIGLIDAEIDSDDLTCAKNERGAIVWNLAVLPEYRRCGVAEALWEQTRARLIGQGVHYCELWTQEDEAANRFYLSAGFALEDSQTWIRCYAEGKACLPLLNREAMGIIYGLEELVFDAPLSRKAGLKECCYRIDEVRLYTIRF